IGMPECDIILAQCVVYLARAPKSVEVYQAYGQVKEDVRQTVNEPVPLHLRNAPTDLMQQVGYGKGYKYSPEYNWQEEQEYLPPGLKGRKYLINEKRKTQSEK
ncbi:MAG: replication-associated recombination protein A, partial [Patescibacteria group bacterium]|nr:replication-associated recombination protein A [Patescibacteria group bacterium]